MSPVGGGDTQLLVQDILAFSDEELVQYMEKNYGAGGFDLDVGDWDELEGEERERFAERLRWGAAQAQVQEPSRPLDLDLLTARLQALPEEPKIAQPRISSAPTTPSAETTPSIDERGEWDMIKREFTAAYDELVRTGGRPMFHISLFDQVQNDLEGHLELFRPFLSHPDGVPSGLEFRGQLYRWQKFLTWQKDCHKTYDKEKEFEALVEEKRREEEERLATMTTRQKRNRERYERRKLYDLRCDYRDAQQEKGLDDTEEGFQAFLDGRIQESLKKGLLSAGMTEDQKRQAMRVRFDIDEHVRRRERGRLRETRGFPAYVDEVKKRLAKHGSEQPFRLEQDPAKQDKLTTWIEYLNYEYSWQDSYERALPRMQAVYDEAWNKLAESGVLYPGENREVLATFESKTTRQLQKSDAYAAYQVARKNAEAALSESEKAKVGQSTRTAAERERDLALATENLEEAKATLRRLQRRSDLIWDMFRATTGLPRTKHELRCQVILTQWIRDQVPLIQAELSASEHPASGSQSPKRGLPEEIDNNRSPKRLRASSDNHSSPDPRPESSLDHPPISRDPTQPPKPVSAKTQRKKSSRAATRQTTTQTTSPPIVAPEAGSPATPQLRRSARVAARANAAAAAEASSSSTSLRQPRGKPRAAAPKQGILAQTAAPSVRGSGKNKGATVNKATTRGGPKKGGGVSKSGEQKTKGKKAKGKTEKGKKKAE